MSITRASLVAGAATLLAVAAQAQDRRPTGTPTRFSHPAPLLSAEQLRQLDVYIADAIKQWQIPGLSLAIVQRDSVVYAKGYGVREIGKPARVDEHTLFAIGSNTKSMTSAVVATLVDDGKMRLDDPVWRYLPNFRVADPYVSREATIRDLLSHRVDVENAIGVWYGAPLTRAQLVDRLRFLKQAASFRSRFLYNNLMVMTAGEAAAAAAGRSWNDLVRERLFTPLGMTESLTSPRELTAKTDNVASPHALFHGAVVAIPHRDTENIGPAGSVYSNAVDMAKYLRMQLGHGAIGGRRVISDRSVDEMRTVTTVIDGRLASSDTAVTTYGYGLAWLVEDYRGHRLIRHNGGIDGMLSEMQFLPDDQVAVMVLTSYSPHAMHTALVDHIFDLALGLPQRDWNGEAWAAAKARETQAASRLKAMESQRAQSPGPAAPLASYAGTYSDSLNGELKVAVEEGKLVLRYHPGFVATLEPWQYSTFRIDWQAPNAYSDSRSFATFTLDASGRPTEVTIDQIGTFRSAPRARQQGGRGQ